WRAPTELGDADPENSFYRTSGVPYVPRHAPFPAPEELWLVRGIPPAIIERMLPFVTVFSNVATVNVLDAAPQVLAALPNMTPESLQSVLSQRGDPALDPRSLPGLSAWCRRGSFGCLKATTAASPSRRRARRMSFPRALRSVKGPCPRPIWHRCSGEAVSSSSFSPGASCFVRSNCRRVPQISSKASCARRSTG